MKTPRTVIRAALISVFDQLTAIATNRHFDGDLAGAEIRAWISGPDRDGFRALMARGFWLQLRRNPANPSAFKLRGIESASERAAVTVWLADLVATSAVESTPELAAACPELAGVAD